MVDVEAVQENCIDLVGRIADRGDVRRAMLVPIADAVRLHRRVGLVQMRMVELFDEPPSIGGNAVVPRPSTFTPTLEMPSDYKPATITPFVDASSAFLSPIELPDVVAAVFLGIALLLGPDFVLAPAGLVSDKGIRPGYSLESVVGALVDPKAQWLKDRREDLKADAPLAVRAPILVLFICAGLLLDRLLLLALEDSTFVISVGICSCIGGGLLELIREPLPTREERDLSRKLEDEFLVFSAQRLTVGGRCHERDIVAAFRSFYPRYRFSDMSRATDGVSVGDEDVGGLVSRWNRSMGRPGERTSTGFWKGISVQPSQAQVRE